MEAEARPAAALRGPVTLHRNGVPVAESLAFPGSGCDELIYAWRRSGQGWSACRPAAVPGGAMKMGRLEELPVDDSGFGVVFCAIPACPGCQTPCLACRSLWVQSWECSECRVLVPRELMSPKQQNSTRRCMSCTGTLLQPNQGRG